MSGAAGATTETPSGERTDFELVRVAIVPEGAFGVLLMDGIPAGPVVLERTYPVDEGAPRGPQFVKIPPGRYRCRRTVYYGGGYHTYEVTGVIGHSRLLFHSGNVELDSEGCLLVGMRFGWMGTKPAVLESRTGFREFMRLTYGRPVLELLVRNAA